MDASGNSAADCSATRTGPVAPAGCFSRTARNEAFALMGTEAIACVSLAIRP